jgi:hypothetical protein
MQRLFALAVFPEALSLQQVASIRAAAGYAQLCIAPLQRAPWANAPLAAAIRGTFARPIYQ